MAIDARWVFVIAGLAIGLGGEAAGSDATDTATADAARSSRTVKSDIHYLSSDEIAALAGDARGLRLATWRYTGKLDDGRTHVGFILEDAPGVPASNVPRGEVDLYGYASMTLALAQQQQREIDDLKRELRELRDGARPLNKPERAIPVTRSHEGKSEVF